MKYKIDVKCAEGVLEDAVEVFNKKIKEGRAYGELSRILHSDIDLEQVSHRVLSMGIEGGGIVGEINVLNTPRGKVLQKLDNDHKFKLRATAKYGDGGHISYLNIIAVDITY